VQSEARANGDLAMERYAAGDDSAFAEVYDAVAPRLFSYLKRQTGDDSRAEDLVQGTLLQMHRARGSFIAGSPVLPWAFAIARRLLIDSLRKRKRDVLTTAEVDTDEACTDGEADRLVEAKQVARRLEQELSRLPESQRIAFELMRFDGLSHVEAAAVLGATTSAVKLRVHRAYAALRAVLGDLADG
jgi:RNA polymerase sigma-70 factor (ECF subfamily)